MPYQYGSSNLECEANYILAFKDDQVYVIKNRFGSPESCPGMPDAMLAIMPRPAGGSDAIEVPLNQSL